MLITHSVDSDWLSWLIKAQSRVLQADWFRLEVYEEATLKPIEAYWSRQSFNNWSESWLLLDFNNFFNFTLSKINVLYNLAWDRLSVFFGWMGWMWWLTHRPKTRREPVPGYIQPLSYCVPAYHTLFANLKFVFQYCLPHIRKVKGNIINVSSLAASIGQRSAIP